MIGKFVARTLCILIAAGCILLASQNAVYAKRMAFVIGIDNYENISVLQKARNDAEAISVALQASGFDVTMQLDPGRRDLIIGLTEFSGRLSPGDEVVFFFAGHGVEVSNRNYLLPADVPSVQPGREMLLTSESIATDKVLDLFQQSGARLSFLILDACRDNPFPKQGLRSTGGSKGLAAIDKELLPVGTFILYSAGVGQTALDRLGNADSDPNSVFTRSLLPLMYEPGLSVGEITRRVRSNVRKLARSVGHEQFPSYYDQIDVEDGAFYFRKPDTRGAMSMGNPDEDVSSTAPTTTTVPNPVDACSQAASMWDAVKDSSSQNVLTHFINGYSECIIYSALAKERLAALQEVAKPAVTAPSGDWFVIAGSYPHADKSGATARLRALKNSGLPVELIDSNDYLNLSDGLYVLVVPTGSRGAAFSKLTEVQRLVKDAYVKKGNYRF